MILKSELLEGHQAYLEYGVSTSLWEKAKEEVLLKEAKQTKVPGFRVGKAPLNMVATRVGGDKLFEYASEDVLRKTYPETIKEANIKALRINNLEIKKDDEGKPIFLVTIDLEPGVTIKKDLDEINIEIPRLPSFEEELEFNLQSLQEGLSHLSLLENTPSEPGKVALFSYKFGENDKQERIRINLGKEEFYPGFDEQVAGMLPGEEREFELIVGESPLRGKVLLEAVYEKELPVIDEELARRLGHQSLEIMMNQLEEKSSIAILKREKEVKTNAIIDTLLSESEFRIPSGLVEDETDEVIGEFLEDLGKKDLTLEKYLEIKGKEMSAFQEEMKILAKRRLEYRLLLEQLARDKELTVSEEEIEKELKELAKKEGLTLPQLKSRLKPDGMRRINNYLLREKMLEILLSSIKVKEV